MAEHSSDSLNRYLPGENIYEHAQNALREMPGHVPVQESLGQTVQRHQEQLPAQALQSLETTGQPKSVPLKRRVTDYAEDSDSRPGPGRDLGPNTESLQKRAPPHFPRPEMATGRRPLPYILPTGPVRPSEPVNPNTRPEISHSGPETEHPALKASSGKVAAPTPALSAFSYMPQNPTDGDFLRYRDDLVQPFNEEHAAMKTSYDSNTIARDILIASGRHPTEPCLNHHLMHLRDMFAVVDTGSDLDTFRWDIVDAPGMQVQRSKSVKNHLSLTTHSAQSRDPACHHLQPSQPAQQPVQQPPPTNQNPSVVSPRDQYHKNVPLSHPVPNGVSQPVVNPPKPTPKPPVGVQLSPKSTSSRLHQSSERQSPALEPQPQLQPRQSRVKSRGRPRKEQSGDMVGTKTAPRVEVAVASEPVSYPVYACEWTNCPAELHNVELLKKHVLKCHIPYTLTCGWLGCTCSDMMAAAQLLEHVKANHIGPLAWKLGDGPSMHRSEDNEEASRSSQAQVTPEANQPGDEDVLIFPASYSSIRAFNRIHGNKSQLDKAHEIFKAVQRLKERIGVGLDPGGCQLATPERNERVSDEEIYELHPESEP